MSDRYDLPKIKPVEQPSILNHEAGKWGYLTTFVGLILSVPMIIVDVFTKAIKHKGNEEALEKSLMETTNKTVLVVTGIGLAGAAFGGLQEKAKQEREQVEGRVVKTPSYWNKGILSGAFVGNLLTLPFTLSNKVGGIGSIVMSLGGVAVGSALRHNELERDYNQAVQLQHHQQQQNHLQQQQQQQLIQQLIAHQATHQVPMPTTYKDSVTKEETQALETKQETQANEAAPSIDASTASKAGTVALSAAKEAGV